MLHKVVSQLSDTLAGIDQDWRGGGEEGNGVFCNLSYFENIIEVVFLLPLLLPR